MSSYVLLFWVLLPTVLLAAFRWGGSAERAGASLYVLAALITLAVRPAWNVRYQNVEIGVLAIDVSLLIGLATIVYRTERRWPIVATALQAVSVLAHVAKALNPAFWRLAYALMSGASSYPTLAVLAVGIWTHRQRMGLQRLPP